MMIQQYENNKSYASLYIECQHQLKLNYGISKLLCHQNEV